MDARENRIATPVCGVLRNDGEMSIHSCKNDTERVREVTNSTAPITHCLAALRPYSSSKAPV